MTQVESDIPIKCWRYTNPHGTQSLTDAFANSCNVAMTDIGLALSGEKLYEYIRAFGFGESTNVGLTGESIGIIPVSPEEIHNAKLATITFGQGLAVTPMQLTMAVGSLANEGKLMKPLIVKEFVDSEGNTLEKKDSEVVRSVVSKQTADQMLDIMAQTMEKSYSRALDLGEYTIGAKTGTTQKLINGKYTDQKHIGSFIAVAPAENPQIVVLAVVDEAANGKYYGIETAGPIGEEVIKNTLDYLNRGKIDEEIEQSENVMVPEIEGMTLREASQILDEMDLDYTTDKYYMGPEDVILEQNPAAGVEVKRKSFIDLSLE